MRCVAGYTQDTTCPAPAPAGRRANTQCRLPSVIVTGRSLLQVRGSITSPSSCCHHHRARLLIIEPVRNLSRAAAAPTQISSSPAAARAPRTFLTALLCACAGSIIGALGSAHTSHTTRHNSSTISAHTNKPCDSVRARLSCALPTATTRDNAAWVYGPLAAERDRAPAGTAGSRGFGHSL